MQRGVFEEKPLFSNASSPLSLFSCLPSSAHRAQRNTMEAQTVWSETPA